MPAKLLIWRREGDSNPRYGFTPYNGLANRRLQPLGHPSAWRVHGVCTAASRACPGQRQTMHHIGGVSPSFPTPIRCATREPSASRTAVTITCAPGASIARAPGSYVMTGTSTGTATRCSPPL
jgi:hypothetical protein